MIVSSSTRLLIVMYALNSTVLEIIRDPLSNNRAGFGTYIRACFVNMVNIHEELYMAFFFIKRKKMGAGNTNLYL